jgi:hypothetical protein
MGAEDEAVSRLGDALERIAFYAEGMVQHYEQHGFGEARSWRVIVRHAREALGRDGFDYAPSSERRQPTPTDEELERLIRRCRLQRPGNSEFALATDEAHERLEQLGTELLLWRHSHPNDLPG